MKVRDTIMPKSDIMTNKISNTTTINSFCSKEQLEKFLNKVCVFDLTFMDKSITGMVKEVNKNFILLEMRKKIRHRNVGVWFFNFLSSKLAHKELGGFDPDIILIYRLFVLPQPRSLFSCRCFSCHFVSINRTLICWPVAMPANSLLLKFRFHYEIDTS